MSGIAWRKWTCNGCGYSHIGTDTYYKMKKAWDTTHTLDFCKARKIEMFPGTMDSLAKLSIMSQVRAKIKTTKERKTKMDKMCVYCESVFTSETIVCSNCNEYDGMMPLDKGIDYLNLDPNDFF